MPNHFTLAEGIVPNISSQRSHPDTRQVNRLRIHPSALRCLPLGVVASQHWVTRFSLKHFRISTANVYPKGLISFNIMLGRKRYPNSINRVVHAKAAGAWGEFEVTNNISSLTSAKFLNGVGKKTPVLFRLSNTGGDRGSADTVRDVRGFAVKFFTEEGNHDIVGNHIVSVHPKFLLFMF